MLRSLGIPARMAVGFAQGEGFTNRDNNIPEEEGFTPGSYTVRKKNAHAWPEVYFPGIGWVEFEPTGNQNPLTRPVALQDTGNITPPNAGLLGEEFSPPPSDNNPEAINDPASSTNNPLLYLVYLIPILIGTAALTIYLSRRYAIPTRIPILLRAGFERSGAQIPLWVANWERWVSISPIEQAFESINFGLRILKEPAPVHATPVERADKLSGILPHLQNPIKVLLDEHQTSLYTSRTADVTEARRAAFQIRMQVIISMIRYFWTGTYFAKT
jgi:hypothetical protein